MFKTKIVILIFVFLIFSISFFNLGYKKCQKDIQLSDDNELLMKDRHLFGCLSYFNWCSDKYNLNINLKNETITLDEFLKDDSFDKNSKTRFNLNREVEYKNKIVLNSKGVPLEADTASTPIEKKIIMKIEGVEPEPGCKPNAENPLACYSYFLENGKEKNYWKCPD